MVKFLALAFVALFFTACTSTTAHITEYRIDPELKIPPLQKGKCSQKTIKVTQTFSSNLYRNLDMNYGHGKYKLDTFTESQWAISLNHAINAQLVAMLNASDLFKNVQVAASRTSNDYILETNIEEFMQYFDEEAKTSQVKVKISMSLLESKTSKVLVSKTFTAELPAKEFNADAGVAALNFALSNVLKDGALWLEEVCQ
jgi:cholesterol transport system auxiliary component